MSKPLAERGDEHASRSHARLNFWGLILGPAVGAVITAAALLWVSVLKQEIRVLKETSPSPLPVSESTPTEAEREVRRLRKELEVSQADAEANKKRAAQLESELRSLKEARKESKTRDETASRPEVSPTSTSQPARTSETPLPRQKLEHFIVEVTRAQTHGDSATVYVRFTSTGGARIKMFLADGLLGHNKTFLVDDSGQHYDLDNSSGIGSCCFGYGGEWHGGVLDLAAKGSADVTLTFLRRSRSGEPERVPKNFTLTAELTVGDAVKLLSSENLQWQSSGSAGISIAGIVPR